MYGHACVPFPSLEKVSGAETKTLKELLRDLRSEVPLKVTRGKPCSPHIVCVRELIQVGLQGFPDLELRFLGTD